MSGAAGRGASRLTVAIVGLGLIGGSLARVLSRRGYRVVGLDRRAGVLRAARRAGAIALAARDPCQAAAEADLVVLAAAPEANLALLRRLARCAPPRLVVTDVSSVKRPICAEARRHPGLAFVGGHPLAGSERSGFAASGARLFRGRVWALTPSRDARALRLVRAMVRAAGARPLLVAPAEHDRAVAFLSHLPQLVAWALAGAARGDPVSRRLRRLAGPGYADMTRLASSPRPMWREILLSNRDQVARARRAFRNALLAKV